MLVQTKPVIYLLLLRFKSLANSFQLELGALSAPSQVRRRCRGRFTMWAGSHESLIYICYWSLEGWSMLGVEVRTWLGGVLGLGRKVYTVTPDTERVGEASPKHLPHLLLVPSFITHSTWQLEWKLSYAWGYSLPVMWHLNILKSSLLMFMVLFLFWKGHLFTYMGSSEFLYIQKSFGHIVYSWNSFEWVQQAGDAVLHRSTEGPTEEVGT